jgi:hypothetical protein
LPSNSPRAHMILRVDLVGSTREAETPLVGVLSSLCLMSHLRQSDERGRPPVQLPPTVVAHL